MQTTNKDLLAAALIGYNAKADEQRLALNETLDRIASIQKQLNTGHAGPVAVGKRPLSASARKRIATAQRKRWIAYRKAKRAA